MDNLKKLQERFNSLVKSLRSEQDIETPDAQKVAKIETEIRAVSEQIETERVIIRTQSGILPEDRSGVGTQPTKDAQEAEHRAAVDAYMRTGDRTQLRAMVTSPGESGGYLVPQSWEDRILEKEKELFVMRDICDVQTSEVDKNIPVVDDFGESEWVDEGGAYPESDPLLSSALMQAHKIGRITKISEELLQDNAYNLEQWLIQVFGYTNGLAMEKAFINGNGTKKPKGFLLDAEYHTFEGPDLKYKELLKLFGSLKTGYTTNAKWLFNTFTLIDIMSLKDDSGAFLYKPFDPKTATEPVGQILGKPVILSSLMPERAIALGDFKRYRIQDRKGFTIQRLNELYADTGFIGFKGMQRTDGKLLIPEAIQVLKEAE